MMYEKAAAEVVYFDNSDVITTSGGGVYCGINVFAPPGDSDVRCDHDW